MIRQAKKDDLKAWRTVAADVSQVFGNPTMADDLEFIDYAERKINQGEALAAVIDGNDNPVGFIGFSRYYNRITWFGVLSGSRNAGIGSELLNAALTHLDSSKEITVETFRSNYSPGSPARHVYMKHGFVEVDNTLQDRLGNERCKLAIKPA